MQIVGLREDDVGLECALSYGHVLEQVNFAFGMEWTSRDGREGTKLCR